MFDWKKNVRKTEPYVPGEQPQESDVVKLNTNENPYPPAPGVKKALKNFEYENLRKYPDPNAGRLIKEIAQVYGVSDDKIFVGVGSDDVIAMSFLTFFNSDKPVLFPDVTYSFYSVWARLYGIEYRLQPLDKDFRIKKEDYMIPNGGIIFANPNAPTSIELPLADVEEIIAANPESVVIVDEAYVDFGGTSAISLVDKYDNLIVVRTFSKSYSMAGMRIGFAVGNPELISALNGVKHSYNSYTMNMPSIECGIEAIRDQKYFDKTRKKIVETRELYYERLKELGFSGPESKTNFLFVTHESISAEKIYSELKKKNIYVRYFGLPRVYNHLRITVGTDEEMQKLYDALAEITGAAN